MESGKSEFEKAIRKTADMGGPVLIAKFRDQATLMKIISQLPYVELDPPYVTERAGTACQGISNVQLKDGTLGFCLVTGGKLTSEEIDTTVDLLHEYGEEQIYMAPGEKSPGQPTPIRQDLRQQKAKPKDKWGCLIVTIGTCILLLGLLVAIVVAFTEFGSFADDPLLFLARAAICILPQFLIGAVLLGIGIWRLRAASR